VLLGDDQDIHCEGFRLDDARFVAQLFN